MPFPSVAYFLFLGVVYVAFWSLARRDTARLVWLAAASVFFYVTWEPFWVLLVAWSTVLDYSVGRALARETRPRRRKLWLTLSLAGNLGALAFFKYANFFADSAFGFAQRLGWTERAFEPWDIALPLGISFYTFQTLSYTIDVYRGDMPATRSPLRFAVFVGFFPQLVAGPVVRARQFLPQLERRPRFDPDRILAGLFRIALGAFKKIALADVLATELVAPVYAAPGEHHALVVLLATYGAMFRFYLDISAYADMAIGAAACVGLRLPENFDRPLCAQSVGEFWRRWHITVSTWFRDYVLRPLGFARPGSWRLFRNMTVTGLLLGLWHGAGWNYVVWGLLNVWVTFAESCFGKPRKRGARTVSGRALRRFLLLHWLGFTMVFFQNGSHLEGLPGWAGTLATFRALAATGVPFAWPSSLGLAVLAVAMVAHYTPTAWVARARELWTRWPVPVQGASLVGLAALLSLVVGERHAYVYFQF